MRTSILARFVGLGIVIVAAGCTGSTPPADHSSPTARPSTAASKDTSVAMSAADARGAQYDVKVASAQGKLSNPAATEPVEPGSLAGSAALPLDESAGEELVMPKVYLSQAHARLCRVGVGDPFPNIELADLEAHQQSLSRLLGKKLTVVVFWNGQQPSALDELKDLGPLVERRFSAQGVTVIGINSGDNPRLSAELAKHEGATFVNLVDPEGAALAEVGTGKIPRTYLVDATGKIVWFDIEYSRTTRRSLSQAIRYLLSQP
jgi:peroxiredoxin